MSGYDVPHGQSYALPTFTADHDTLHLEAADNFFYRWTQLTYSLVPWFSAGYVVQRIWAFHAALDSQRGLLVESTRKKVTFSTQILDLGDTDPVLVFSLGYSF